MGTMRRHSILDVLTLWGGVTMFLLVVVYVVAKRTIHFVPQFAVNLVTYPFQSRYQLKYPAACIVMTVM